ncbi:hypothetical protein BVX97_05095 [bacterium E08(2017)]|nr:hypothetical protein BVX97_05095 [bacterium E08(2017)]
MGEFGIFILFIAFFAVAAYFAHIASKKRREAFEAIASDLNLHYTPTKNRDMAKRYKFLKKLAQGSNRYAYNILSGPYKDHRVLVFDYHYETRSDKNTHHYHFSFFILFLGKHFPELTITNEHIFSKIAQAIGFDDIDFESHEFSSKYTVRSKDKKFAYDVCNSKMIEFLLNLDGINLEIDQDVLAVGYSRKLAPEVIEQHLNRLIAIRELMPDYLFKGE